MTRKPTAASALSPLLALLILSAAACDSGVKPVPFSPKHYWAPLYWNLYGPYAVASALGSAAPPGGHGCLSALGTEAGWRTCCQPQTEGEENWMPSLFEVKVSLKR
jgi:hypothetical protein